MRTWPTWLLAWDLWFLISGYESAHGSTSFSPVMSEKSLVFRVARARHAVPAIAAICASSTLIGWPCRFRSETIRAYSPAASQSKGRQRPGKSSWNICSARSSKSAFRLPAGNIEIPSRISATVTALIHTSHSDHASSHRTTLGLGMGRINSESTLVSRRITARHPKKKQAAGADWTAALPPNPAPRLRQNAWKYRNQCPACFYPVVTSGNTLNTYRFHLMWYLTSW